jgi:CBS domain-containing protein
VAQWERARLDEADSSNHNYLRVEQYMNTDLFTVQPNDPIEIVAHLMLWERLRQIAVEDKDHHLLGVITYRAVLRHLAGGPQSKHTSVADLMKRDVTTVGPETPTIDALRLMRRYRVGCLPVVQDGYLVGMVTEEDFMEIASKMLERQFGGGSPESDDEPMEPMPDMASRPELATKHELK